ncbi:WecB/TagA/CpsF family glycosyltransferase [Eionea flava]
MTPDIDRQFIDNSSVKDSIIRSLTLLPSDGVSPFVDSLSQVTQPTSVGFVNQHAYNIMHRDSQVQVDFSHLTYRLRDGAGIKLACQYNDCDPGANLNGTDFIPALLSQIYRVKSDCCTCVFGTEEPWLSTGSASLLGERECILLNGFESDDVYIRQAKECAEQCVESNDFLVIVLAMGMPKQERVSRQLMQTLTTPTLIICGGAIIDFYAGRFSRAPAVFRRCGLEWLYRLCVEPKRLFRRYVIGIPEFFFYMLKNKNQ